MRDFPASGRHRPARDPDPDLAVRAHDSGGRAVRSGAPDSRLREVRSPGEAEYTHPLDAARASRRRAPPVPTRPAAAGSRSGSSARRQVAAAREAARAPSAAAVRPERRQLRQATRDTGSVRPARLRGGRRSGVHGHDGGDADVQSCSADGQGENSRITPRACSRRAVCDMSNRSVAVWNGSERMSRGSAARLRRGSSNDVGYGATRLVLCLDRLPARIPHAGSGERSYMGRGASSRLVPPSKTEHWSCRVDARSVDAERCRTDGRNEYRQQSRFAQPTRGAANFVPGLRR